MNKEIAMKKIISIFILLAILAGSFVNIYADEKIDSEISSVVKDTIVGLGLIEKDKLESTDAITRGEFADVLYNIYVSGDKETFNWKQEFFEDESKELYGISLENGTSDETSYYSDVLPGDEHYMAITTLSRYGLLNGLGSGYFGVSENVTKEQVSKVMLIILGYGIYTQQSGGYPNGYSRYADELKLWNGIKDNDMTVTYSDIAKVLYNMLEIDIVQFGYINEKFMLNTVEGENFLKKILGLEKCKGRMENNGYSGLSNANSEKKNNIVVCDIEFNVPEDAPADIPSYLGREVIVYYNEEGTVRCVVATDKEKSIVFDDEDFLDYDGNSISYLNENDVHKRIQLKDIVYVIKNGTAVPSFDKSVFLINSGTIEVISGRDLVDVIIINEYFSFDIGYIDFENKILYSENTLINTDIKIDLNEENSIYVRIFDEGDSEISLNDLSKGNIITVFASDRAVTIYKNQSVISGYTVKSVGYDDRDKVIVSDGKDEYTFSKEFEALYGKNTLRMNNTYTLTLNMFGEVVKAERAAGGNNFGIIIRPYRDDNDEFIMQLKYFTNGGKVERTKLAQKVKFIYADKKNETVSRSLNLVNSENYNFLYDELSGYKNYVSDNTVGGGIFKYKLNENKEISEIELPGVQKVIGNEKGRLLKIVATDTDIYFKVTQGFGGKLMYNSNTEYMGVDVKNTDKDDGFEFYSDMPFLNDKKYNNGTNGYITGYTINGDSPMADVIVYETSLEKEAAATDRTFAIVNKVTMGLDRYDSMIWNINCYVNGTTEQDLSATDEAINSIKNMKGETSYTDENGNRVPFKLEAGDIIRYAFDGQGNISAIYLVYDENAKNPSSGGKGNIAGSIGKFDELSAKLYNPVVLDTNNTLLTAKSYIYGIYGELRYTACFPYEIYNGDCLKVTTGDLKTLASITALNEEEGYSLSNWVLDQNTLTVVTKSKNGVEIENASMSELRTYKTTGKDCDRMVIVSRYGAPYGFIVYRD